MALLRSHLQIFHSNNLRHSASSPFQTSAADASSGGLVVFPTYGRHRCCSAIAIDAPSSLTGVTPIRWGYTSFQGFRDEMEDDIVIRSEALDDFSFAAVFDGHAGSSSVRFLREELYKECVVALQGGSLLSGGDFTAIKETLVKSFESVDQNLLKWLETNGEEEDESGSTATVMFIRNDICFIAHIGDSCALKEEQPIVAETKSLSSELERICPRRLRRQSYTLENSPLNYLLGGYDGIFSQVQKINSSSLQLLVLSRSGQVEELTDSHRPYGSSKASIQEMRRIRESGGWIVNGRICGDIAVSRAFGDIRFKTKKYEMLKKGVTEGRWSEKFVSRIEFKRDIVVATPDIYQVPIASDVEFIILASDGLWDYMKSSDVVNYVREELRKHGNVQLACEALGQVALDRQSQDNISIIIADLGRTEWKNLPVKRQNTMVELVQAMATIGIVTGGIWMSSFLLS